MNPVIFVFRRDLRLVDNTALNKARASGSPVITLFVRDQRQFEPHPYRSEFGLRFLKQSLVELDRELAANGGGLWVVKGLAEEIVPQIAQKYDVKAVYVNRDYTPFARRRDEALEAACKRIGAGFESMDDALLNSPTHVLKDNGQPYTVFTPFYKRALKTEVAAPTPLANGSWFEGSIKEGERATGLVEPESSHPETLKGGRKAALVSLSAINTLVDYKVNRDFPARSGTSRLSPHHKFGTISIRESYARAAELFGTTSDFIRELYWRDFFTQIAFHFPHVFERSFNRAYDAVEWDEHPDHFDAWCQGMTGFPIVDAGMRELNATGLMHNRVRMIVASFLTKDLHIHWRLGERYFAQKLIDYDPAVNNGSWQWAASTGCDAQPYFRIFNPWLQQERFDPECRYIKKWVPELESWTAKEIHNPERDLLRRGSYPESIVDHAREKKRTEELFARALKRGG